METRRLHLRDKFGHPDIVMSVDGKPGSDWLINYFSEQVHDGVCFKAGQTVQVGWALVKLVGDGSDGLTVLEPDFSSMPVEWVAGTSRVMRQLIVQREVCDQIGAAPCFPSMIEPGAVSPGFIGGRSAFTMSRDEDGWLFRSKDDKGHEAGLRSLYAVGIGRTAVVPFLALPRDAEIEWGVSNVEIRFGGRQCSSTSNAFLRELFASPVLF